MVHALDEIRRTLKTNGTLIDLRPVESNWLVEISSSAGYQLAGRLNDMPVGLGHAFRNEGVYGNRMGGL